MQVVRQIPKFVPLIMGTADLGNEARKTHKSNVWVLEPPIDVVRDSPAIDGSAFRQMHGVADHELLVVSVSRLALDLKIDALVKAIDAVNLLADRYPLRLILIGDGLARDALSIRAQSVNERCGREVVTIPGADLDPRAAYAAADLVIGMGSSALRAMAIRRPLIVQGERAFSEIFEPATYDLFLRQGFYGVGEGSADASLLAGQMESLLSDPARREGLSYFGRKVVEDRFSLSRAVGIQLDIYDQIRANPPRRNLLDATRSALLALMVEIANHDPWRKCESRLREQEILTAAAQAADLQGS
jgi:glycosyltransferase involved in cell wall biosynthesis